MGLILNTTLEVNCQFAVPLDCVAQLVEAIVHYDKFKIDVPTSLWVYLKKNKFFSTETIKTMHEKMEDHLFPESAGTTPNSKAELTCSNAVDVRSSGANLSDALDAAAELLPQRQAAAEQIPTTQETFLPDANPLDQLQVHAEYDAFSYNLVKEGVVTCQSTSKVLAEGWEYALLGQCLDQGGLLDPEGKPVVIHADFALDKPFSKELLVKCLEDGSKYNVFESKLYSEEEPDVVSDMLRVCTERYGPQPKEEEVSIISEEANDAFNPNNYEQPRWKAKEGRKMFLLEFEEVNSLGLPLF